VSENEKLPTFVPLLAYSTGLLIGRFLVDIVSDLIGVPSREGNRMSTVKADVLELLEDAPADRYGEIERVLSRITLAKDYPHPARELSGVEASMWQGLQQITSPSAEAELLTVLTRLPDDCTTEDVLDELDEREGLRQGLASAIYEPRISQEEMEAWLEQWARE
jgi:hypothetical protein